VKPERAFKLKTGRSYVQSPCATLVYDTPAGVPFAITWMAAPKLEDTMKIVVIGGTGFIGSSVVLGLDARGHDVAVFSRGEREFKLPGSVTHIRGDRDRLHDSREALQEFGHDAVVDFILFTEAQAEGLVEVMAPFVERIVGISSCDVYRKYADDYEKILVEEVLQGAQGVSTTVLRLPAVYGPGDRQRRFGHYIRQMKSGADTVRFPADKAEWRFTHGFVENVAAAIAEATVHPAASDRTFNVGESVTPTFKERLQQLGVNAPVDRRTALTRTFEWGG